MTEKEAIRLIKSGESITVEFNKSVNEITEDIYVTVCSFSNRDGGHIFLGVGDNGKILGVSPDGAEKMKKEFFSTVNDPDKLYPTLHLNWGEIEIDGRMVLYVEVPAGTQVCRYNGRFFDRTNGSDVDVTNDSDEVYRLYARKQNTYFVNSVTDFKMSDLRPDLIDRARKMSRIRNMNHPWLTMGDEELLRSTGLILKDDKTMREGITLAAVLLFGNDIAIMSALPQHKTDAIFRVEDVDHYDDRDVIITNLFDTFDRLMDFGKKHLSDPFVLEGIHSVSARDKILREIFSNLLAHRDYSSAYVAKFVIEKHCMYTENASRAHGFGMLEPSSFEPFSKNPAISRIFRETSLADELGSGMRNTYRYTEMYSGGIPKFLEGNVFKTMIPLSDVSVGKVGPSGAGQTGFMAGGTFPAQDEEQINVQADEMIDEQAGAKMSGQYDENMNQEYGEQVVEQMSDQASEQPSGEFEEQMNGQADFQIDEDVKNKDVFQRLLTFLREKF